MCPQVTDNRHEATILHLQVNRLEIIYTVTCYLFFINCYRTNLAPKSCTQGFTAFASYLGDPISSLCPETDYSDPISFFVCVFSQSSQADSGIVSQITTRTLPSIPFIIYG
jgi:hypothetical protein